MMGSFRETNNLNPSLDIDQTQNITSIEPLNFEQLLVGRFKIIALKGSGRFGRVYQAIDLKLDTTIAIKLLYSAENKPSTLLADFKNEILLLRKLSHPNILRVHEYYQDDQLHFITMDWLEGESLAIKLSRNKLSVEEVESYSAQLIKALVFAESNSIVHGDLKPDNILLDEQGHLTIVDFGLASMQADNKQDFVGTPVYASAEYLSHGKIDLSNDRYAFGVVFYQMCCHQLPFKAVDLESLIQEKLIGSRDFVATDKYLFRYRDLSQVLLSPFSQARPQSSLQISEIFEQAKGHKKRPWWPLLVTLILMLSLVFYLGNKPSKEMKPVASYHSLAILPVIDKQLSEPNAWLSSALPVLLFRELKAHPKIRLLENDRVFNTINYLGFKPPLSSQQLKVIADLLQVDYLLQAEVLSTGVTQQVLTINLVNIVGATISNQEIFHQRIETNAANTGLGQIAGIILDKLSSEKMISQAYDLSVKNLQLLTETQRAKTQQDFLRVEKLLKQILESQNDYPDGWMQLGELYLDSERYDEATVAFQKILNLTANNLVVHQLAEAHLFSLAGKVDKEQLVYQNLLQQFPYRNDLRFKLATLYSANEQQTKAENLLLEVVAQDQNHPTAWLEIAKLSIMSGQIQKAIDDYLVRALIISNRLNDKQTKGDVLNALGVAYQRLGDINNAIDNYNLALEVRYQINNIRGAATTMSNLASLLAIRGDYELAFNYLNKGLDIYSKLQDSQGTSDLYNELGVLSEELGQYHEALKYFKKSLNLRNELKNDWLRAESQNNVGYIYFLLGDFEHALVYWQQAEQNFIQVDDPISVIRVKQNYAQLHLQKGQWQSAYQLFETSLSESKVLNLDEETLVSQAYLAKLAFIQGGFSVAFENINAILGTLEQRQDLRGIIEFSLWAADWHLLCGNQTAAIKNLERIQPLLKDQANQEQNLYFSILQESMRDNFLVANSNDTNEITVNDLALELAAQESAEQETPIPVKLKKLLYQAEKYFLNYPTKFQQYIDALNQLNVTQYPYENMLRLELVALQAVSNANWSELEQVLEEASSVLKNMGNYWRRFQFERLKAILYKQQGKPYLEILQRSNEDLVQLQNQLAERFREDFVYQQNRLIKKLTLGDEFELNE